MSAGNFCASHPRLFHVADGKAQASIRRHGLLSAESLCDLFEVSPGERERLLAENRKDYERLSHTVHGEAWLRRQYAWDGAMRTRLRPGLTPQGWRRFLNQHVFLHASERAACRFAGHEKERWQVVLVWETRALLDAGLRLRTCRWNNGMVDRSPAHRRRLRGEDDYIPVAEFDRSRPISEVAMLGGIPSSVPFVVLPAMTS